MEDNITRGDEILLLKDQYTFNTRKHALSQRTINEWHTLYTDCVQSIHYHKGQ